MTFSEYFPVWNKLTDQQQNHLLSVVEFRKVAGGTVVHSGGSDCLGMLIIAKGQLRAYILSDEGREITISRFFEMDCCLFSASCVMPNMQMDIIIEAEKDTQFWVVPACLYQNLIHESLPISNYSQNLIMNHYSELMWLMEQIMWKSFDKRLAAFLLEECALEETDSLKITHEKIANHMGTAREVVTRMLRYFQSEGMVRLTRGSVDIVDRKKLMGLQD